MEIIPLIQIYKRKIVKQNFSNHNNIHDLLNNYKDNFIYILDHDGINKNRPNLCTFQKFVKNHDLWVDTGPRVIGDVVDSVVAGASKVTVREHLIKKLEINDINEILENEIYFNISSKTFTYNNSYLEKTTGFVILDYELLNYDNFKFQSNLKNLINNNITYLYLKNIDNYYHINKLNFNGLLIDIEKIKEFENIGI